MLKIILLAAALQLSIVSVAHTFKVSNAKAFELANHQAQPGDTIELADGIWKNVVLIIDCKGTKSMPIICKAQHAGKVIITGYSSLRIAGSYIEINGLNFKDGYAGNAPVICFKNDKNEVANYCRITNSSINNYNNAQRLEENYWVALYGKRNRIDHCNFTNKLNMGVLLAVILDEDKNRNNFHSIDHNYFGVRLPLASNTGEIIRVGLADHCEFNSNTIIADNHFENCDGEAEIISIKSCSNIIRNNLFTSCQGAVVLRHGNFNTVEYNIFLGNGKAGTGGVRIINKGQQVINNYFYKCRGLGFRAPLSIMNGVPNSPAVRYVAVTDAVIANNIFMDCSPMNFCLGSDAERTVTPAGVECVNNIFSNNIDSVIYMNNDHIEGIHFSGNCVSESMPQRVGNGFQKMNLSNYLLECAAMAKLQGSLKDTTPNSFHHLLPMVVSKKIQKQFRFKTTIALNQLAHIIRMHSGKQWQDAIGLKNMEKPLIVSCATVEALRYQLLHSSSNSLIISLTGKSYHFKQPLYIQKNIVFTSASKSANAFSFDDSTQHFLMVKAGCHLYFKNAIIDLSKLKAKSFISTDTSGNSLHSKLVISCCTFIKSKGNFFSAAKTSVLDTLLVTDCNFIGGSGVVFNMGEENDKKGYYNTEHFIIKKSCFNNYRGQLVRVLRSGTDESTMGPFINFNFNEIITLTPLFNLPCISFNGVQQSIISNNRFYNCNPLSTLISYEDRVSAIHLLNKNYLKNSGTIVPNKYVTAINNHSIQ